MVALEFAWDAGDPCQHCHAQMRLKGQLLWQRWANLLALVAMGLLVRLLMAVGRRRVGEGP